ncbi:prenylated Rab acceptor protein 1 [Toxorhynchites rutilus septentrionalis]|uniref:prenylated Rab acceptor protein 1 n=1 Tax=Toxorhynchites rutilus septentrionalis TaxID=329112 RepID=UPI00247A2FD0|nr:prenylated Rab acceptor protein 1 [Toxorhynchites rutilus septentrionalis]
MQESDVHIDMSGDMEPPKQESKSLFNVSTFTNFSARIPSLWEFLRITRQNVRPWSEFLQTANFKTVANVPRLTNRIIRNLGYFQSNYLFVFLGLIVYCLLTSPLILIVLGCVFYACYRIKQANAPVAFFSRQLNTNQQCIAVNVAAIPVLYLAGAGAVMFWVLGASFFVISLHAAFYNIDAIVTEDTETFLSETV